MLVGKNVRSLNCTLGGEILKQVSEAKYLGCIFTENASFDREIEERIKKGNIVISQLRSAVFRKKELKKETKVKISKAIFRPTLMYGSESWVDSGNLIHKLEVVDMRLNRMIVEKSR